MLRDDELPIIGRSDALSDNSLLTVKTITKMAFDMLSRTQDARSRWEQNERVYELRKSCGASNPPMRIVMGPMANTPLHLDHE